MERLLVRRTGYFSRQKIFSAFPSTKGSSLECRKPPGKKAEPLPPTSPGPIVAVRLAQRLLALEGNLFEKPVFMSALIVG